MPVVSRLLKRLGEPLTKIRRHLQPRGSVYMFLPINGAGLGHLTRCLAIARQLRLQQPESQIIFVTTSIAVPLVLRFGFICHHITPFNLSALEGRDWNRLLASTVNQLVDLYRPAVFVFDGSKPYAGLRQVLRRHPAVHHVWIRRGGYKATVDQPRLLRDQRLFSQVLIPTEVYGSEPGTPGASAIEPILLLAPDERLPPLEAARALGVEASYLGGKRFVYVQLGAGNIDDIHDVRQGIISHLAQHGFAVIVGESPIGMGLQATHFETAASAAHWVRDYPNSRYFALFQFAVLAGGYNSVCEAVAMGLPAIFVPNLHTVTDDQLARAQSAATEGIYEVLTDPAVPFPLVLDRLLTRLQNERAPVPVNFDGAKQAADKLLLLAGQQA